MRFIHPLTLIAILFTSLLFACNTEQETDLNDSFTANNVRTLDDIVESGQLNVGINYSPTDYFVYKGQLLGFQYEMMNKLADYINVDINFVIIENENEQYEQLKEGKIDLIASNLTVFTDPNGDFSFSDPYATTKLVVVQRKKESTQSNKEAYATVLEDLSGKTVHSARHLAHKQKLEGLAANLEEPFYLWDVDEKVTQFQLIDDVSKGYVDFAIADKNIASLLKSQHPNIDLSLTLYEDQQISWPINKQANGLEERLNEWLLFEQGEVDIYVLYNKYYRNNYVYNKYRSSEYLAHKTGKISKFDPIIRQYSNESNFDWKLISAIICQESNFNPKAVSWAGAKGLMQLMPRTAKSYGKYNLFDPVENIKVGTKHLRWLHGYWSKTIEDKDQLLKFILASYNVGTGHLQDARKLAEKYGKDPNVWEDNVDIYLKLKSNPQYYKDDVVKYGYCKGSEPYKYVYQITERYEQYQVMLGKSADFVVAY